MTLLLTGFAAKAVVPTPTPVPPVPDTSGHRHKNSAGKWVTVTDGKHRHADLEARIKALEDHIRSNP